MLQQSSSEDDCAICTPNTTEPNFEILLLTPDPAFRENKLHRSFVFSTIHIRVGDRAHGDAHSCNEMFVNKQIFTLLEVTYHLFHDG